MKVAYTTLFLLAITACAPVRLVKPLEKGQKAIGANLGGPLINFAGAPIPLPYTSAFLAKGITEKTSVFGGVHLTALAFGVAQIELGACRQIWVNPTRNIGVSINPALHIAVDKWEWNTRFWPQLDAQFYKTFKNQSYFYAGIGNWFEPTRVRPHQETQEQFWFMYPQLGYRWGKKQWNYGLETKWVGPNIKNQPNVADYIGINHNGAVGVYFSFMRRF
jgi:hypothetical protein